MRDPDDADLRPAHLASIDQSAAEILDTIPHLMWGLYSRFREEGFDQRQAMSLTRTYLTATVADYCGPEDAEDG